MLPHTYHSPSHATQFHGLAIVSLPVFRELRKPIALIGFGIGRVFGTAMPEASIDEDGDPRRNEDDIDENALGSTMKSISELFLEKGSAQGYLGR
jgi:hypothetical protein